MRTLLLLLLVLVTATTAGSAVAAPAPPPGDLWSDFPLEPRETQPPESPQQLPPPQQGASQPAASSDDSGNESSPWRLLALAVAAVAGGAAAALALALGRRRRRVPVPREAPAVLPATAYGPPSASHQVAQANQAAQTVSPPAELPGVTLPAALRAPTARTKAPKAKGLSNGGGAVSVAEAEAPAQAVTAPTVARPVSLFEILSPPLQPDPLGEEPAEELEEARIPDAATQVGEIRIVRGYRESRFALEADPPLAARLESVPFPARASGTPEQTDALGVLIAQLIVEGWEPDGLGADWFSYRFRRDLP